MESCKQQFLFSATGDGAAVITLNIFQSSVKSVRWWNWFTETGQTVIATGQMVIVTGQMHTGYITAS